jgi:Zn-dependent protease
MSYFGIGKTELMDLALSLAVLIIGFSLVGSRSRGLPGIEVILISALGVGTGFILHELAHKFVAQRYGYWAEYRASRGGLIFIILMAMAGIIFAAPGAVMISRSPHSLCQNSSQIDADFLESLRRKDNAEQLRIALAGPMTNIVLAVLFFGLLVSGVLSSQLSMSAAYFAFFINLNLAAFNLIPFGPLDGRKIYQSSPAVWAIVGIPTILVALPVVFGIRIF